jgi:hypothetical protein
MPDRSSRKKVAGMRPHSEELIANTLEPMPRNAAHKSASPPAEGIVYLSNGGVRVSHPSAAFGGGIPCLWAGFLTSRFRRRILLLETGREFGASA